jgi:hypothetical protein
VRRQHLLELDERADRRLLDAGDRRPCGRAEPHRDGDGLLLVEQQRRHRGTCAQPVAARRAGQRLDRVPERAQAVDVAPHGPRRDLEPLGQLRAGPVAPRLEQRQQIEEAAGGLEHENLILSKIEDRS